MVKDSGVQTSNKLVAPSVSHTSDLCEPHMEGRGEFIDSEGVEKNACFFFSGRGMLDCAPFGTLPNPGACRSWYRTPCVS